MTLTRLTPEDYITTRWSGGATTELLIWPRGAAYAQKRKGSHIIRLQESACLPVLYALYLICHRKTRDKEYVRCIFLCSPV